MSYSLQIRAIGNSRGVIFPKELLAKLRADGDGMLYITETPEGFLLHAHDPEFERQMKVAEDVMHEYRDVLHMLAK